MPRLPSRLAAAAAAAGVLAAPSLAHAADAGFGAGRELVARTPQVLAFGDDGPPDRLGAACRRG
jgi:hypothetical protein